MHAWPSHRTTGIWHNGQQFEHAVQHALTKQQQAHNLPFMQRSIFMIRAHSSFRTISTRNTTNFARLWYRENIIMNLDFYRTYVVCLRCFCFLNSISHSRVHRIERCHALVPLVFDLLNHFFLPSPPPPSSSSFVFHVHLNCVLHNKSSACRIVSTA